LRQVDQIINITKNIEERTVRLIDLGEETRDGIKACANKISGLRTLVMEVGHVGGC